MRIAIRNAAIVVVGLVIGMIPSQLMAQSGSAAVDTRMSLFLAGGNGYTTPGGDGISPFEIILLAGTGRILRVDASGTATYCPNAACPTTSPDGPTQFGPTNINSSGSIAGLLAPTSGFLAGVFLGPTLPLVPPTRLDFNVLTTTFLNLSGIQLGQTFFIGDGFGLPSQQQQFFVPDGATRLYLGIVDGGGFVGDPSFYNDNVGTYTARYSITGSSTVPEPSTIALMAAGLAALVAVRRRKAE